MEQIKVNIMHKLNNRVRLKFSSPIVSMNEFEARVLVGGEDIKLRYNNINNTLVANFNPNEITLEETIYKILTAYKDMNGQAPLDVIDGKAGESIKDLQQKKYEGKQNMALAPIVENLKHFDKSMLMSAGSLLMSGAGAACGRGGGGRGRRLQRGANMVSGGMTSFAILGHAYRDMSQNKGFDIEVVPAMFLLKSFISNPKPSTLAVTLATAFGRHLLTGGSKTSETKAITNQSTSKLNLFNNRLQNNTTKTNTVKRYLTTKK